MTTDQPILIAALARVYVDDLDEALPLYRMLTGEEPHLFEFRGLRLAKSRLFLLIEGAGEEIRSHAATIAARDIDTVAATVQDAGGQVLEGPAPGSPCCTTTTRPAAMGWDTSCTAGHDAAGA